MMADASSDSNDSVEQSGAPFSVASDLDLSDRIKLTAASGAADVRIAEGDVPRSLDDCASGDTYQVRRDQLLLFIPDGTVVHVENGSRITFRRGPETSDRDLKLFILGTAWGGLCYQRGLVPIHASAVVHAGQIFGFTGRSGAGKSTIAANLARYGPSFFADDTLICDLAAEVDGVFCHAGQRQTKLWRDAIERTESEAIHRVRSTAKIEKYFAEPHRLSAAESGSMKQLCVLRREVAPQEPANILTSLKGARAMQAITANLYRPHFAEPLLGRKRYFASIKALSERLSLSAYSRSVAPENYEASIAFMLDEIRRLG